MERPGGALAARPLHFFWLVDCSPSMEGRKIESLNFAIRESIPAMKKVADENPNARILVRAIRFSRGAQWHVADPAPIDDFKWPDVNVDQLGVTDYGAAFNLLADALTISNMPERGLPPVCVLASDGQPTDDFRTGLQRLMRQPWGAKAVRLAIAIGDDADLDLLQEFIGHPEIRPLHVHSAHDLVTMIKWASTVPLKAASNPASRTPGDSGTANVPLPAPPAANKPISAEDVW